MPSSFWKKATYTFQFFYFLEHFPQIMQISGRKKWNISRRRQKCTPVSPQMPPNLNEIFASNQPINHPPTHPPTQPTRQPGIFKVGGGSDGWVARPLPLGGYPQKALWVRRQRWGFGYFWLFFQHEEPNPFFLTPRSKPRKWVVDPPLSPPGRVGGAPRWVGRTPFSLLVFEKTVLQPTSQLSDDISAASNQRRRAQQLAVVVSLLSPPFCGAAAGKFQ